MVEEEPSVEELKRLLRRLEKIEALSDPARPGDALKTERSSSEGLASLRSPLPPVSFSFPEMPPAFPVSPPAVERAAVERAAAERAPEFQPAMLRAPDLAAAPLPRPTPVGPPVQVPASRSGLGTLLIAMLLGGAVTGGVAVAVLLGAIELPIGRNVPLVTTVPSPEPETRRADVPRPPLVLPAAPKTAVEAPPDPPAAVAAPAAPPPGAAAGVEAPPPASLSLPSALPVAPVPTTPAAEALGTIVASVEVPPAPEPATAPVDAAVASPSGDGAPPAAVAPELVLPIEAPPVVAAPMPIEGVRLATADTWSIPAGIRVALPLAIEPAEKAADHYVLVVGLEPDALVTRAIEIITGTWMIRGPDLAGAEIERAAQPPQRLAGEIELRTMDGAIVGRQSFTLLSDAAAALAAAPPPPRPATPTKPDAAEAQRLLRRGQSMLESGNIGGARLLFQRAAELGSGEAALSLGRTYDPTAVPLFGATDVSPDRIQARRWYERAIRLGRAEAQERLNFLDSNR